MVYFLGRIASIGAGFFFAGLGALWLLWFFPAGRCGWFRFVTGHCVGWVALLCRFLSCALWGVLLCCRFVCVVAVSGVFLIFGFCELLGIDFLFYLFFSCFFGM